jgi:hypothetical protein
MTSVKSCVKNDRKAPKNTPAVIRLYLLFTTSLHSFKAKSRSRGQIDLQAILSVGLLGGRINTIPGNAIPTAKGFFIGGKRDPIIPCSWNRDIISLVAAHRAEIKDKDPTVPLTDQNLLLSINKDTVRRLGKELGFGGKGEHGAIKILKIAVFEKLVIRKMPLSAAIEIAPAVSLSWEIDPFGMTELIAHKVEVSFPAKSKRYQADHLVQGNSAINNGVLYQL